MAPFFGNGGLSGKGLKGENVQTTAAGKTRELAIYLSQAKDHLHDLPPDVQDDLLGDLSQMIVEVSAEIEGPIRDLLGPPAKMVAELRASAGLVPPANPKKRYAFPAIEWQGSYASFRDWLAARWPDTLVSLRHTWWIGRALVATMLLAMVTSSYPSVASLFGAPFPAVLGSALIGILVFGLLAVWSVALGHRSLSGETSHRAALVGNVFLAIAAVYIVGELPLYGPSRSIIFSDQPEAMLRGLLSALPG